MHNSPSVFRRLGPWLAALFFLAAHVSAQGADRDGADRLFLRARAGRHGPGRRADPGQRRQFLRHDPHRRHQRQRHGFPVQPIHGRLRDPAQFQRSRYQQQRQRRRGRSRRRVDPGTGRQSLRDGRYRRRQRHRHGVQDDHRRDVDHAALVGQYGRRVALGGLAPDGGRHLLRHRGCGRLRPGGHAVQDDGGRHRDGPVHVSGERRCRSARTV